MYHDIIKITIYYKNLYFMYCIIDFHMLELDMEMDGMRSFFIYGLAGKRLCKPLGNDNQGLL